jgi:hypothetical protein
VKENVEPRPTCDSTQSFPPCISMMRFEMASPSSKPVGKPRMGEFQLLSAKTPIMLLAGLPLVPQSGAGECLLWKESIADEMREELRRRVFGE